MKLHLGCGKRYMPGYEHVDLADFPHINYRHSVKTLPKYADNSVDLIYFSHGIEYFDREEIKQVLAEYERVLKPGGILRLAMPNFKELAHLYLDQDNLDLVIGPIYGRWPIDNAEKTIVYHKTIYDAKSLRNLLYDSGFLNIKYWDWREVFVDELEGFDDYSKAYYPHLDFEKGQLLSLNMECTKG